MVLKHSSPAAQPGSPMEKKDMSALPGGQAGGSANETERPPEPRRTELPHASIDRDALKIIDRLTAHKHTAYLVGGCVRDLLLSRMPKDFDIATSATPPEIKSLFRNCRIIGRRFRLAHIFFGAKIIETSTFRSDPRGLGTGGEGGPAEPDAAHQSAEEILIRRDNVFGTPEEDSLRRDFTVNGLFYDVGAGRVIDYVAGMPDLERRLVRTIGDPDIRFREDPVRILRAIKFAARLGFGIEPETYRAMVMHREEISKCPTARVVEEVYRLFRGGAAYKSMQLLEETGVLGVLLPSLKKWMSEGSQLLYAYLRGLDALGREPGSEPPSNALVVASLVVPFLRGQIVDETMGNMEVLSQIESATQPLFTEMTVARKDSARCRMLLFFQRRLTSRRMPRPDLLAQHEVGIDALKLLELSGEAEGRPALLERHRQLVLRLADARYSDFSNGGQTSADSEAAELTAMEPDLARGTRKRRRRRRGRPGGRTENGTPRSALPATGNG